MQDEPAALALLAHPDRGGPGAGERAAQVDVDDGVEVVVGHLPQHAVAQDAGVGDHARPAGRTRSTAAVDQRLGGLASCRPARPRPTARPPAAVIASTAASADVGVDVVDDDGGAGRGERPGVGRPRPAPAAGDDGDLAGQVHGSTFRVLRVPGDGMDEFEVRLFRHSRQESA